MRRSCDAVGVLAIALYGSLGRGGHAVRLRPAPKPGLMTEAARANRRASLGADPMDGSELRLNPGQDGWSQAQMEGELLVGHERWPVALASLYGSYLGCPNLRGTAGEER